MPVIPTATLSSWLRSITKKHMVEIKLLTSSPRGSVVVTVYAKWSLPVAAKVMQTPVEIPH